VNASRTLLMFGALATAFVSGCRVRTIKIDEGDISLDGGLGGAGGQARPDGAIGGAGGGAGGTAGGAGPDGGGGPDATRPDACVGMIEECNGLDDDCDGLVDEDFNKDMDTAHCGACDNVCAFDHAFPACVAGRCQIQACLPSFVDTDKMDANGCECLETNGGREICDDLDNDCNGMTDETFDKMTDTAHCGRCNTICEYTRAAASCDLGVCRMGACDAGYLNINNDPVDGCEYKCTPSGVELCDGQDNDCDGLIDNNPIDAGGACGPPQGNVGECRTGTMLCTTATLLCRNAVSASLETCDDKDNDCDGTTDEDFDKQTDIRWCGGCRPCDLAHAVPRCVIGACEIDACSPGYENLDGRPENGCEYSCTRRGLEVCNGQDDDCNGMTDDGIDKNTDVNNCGACGRVCKYTAAAALCQGGVCKMGACDPNFTDVNGNDTDGCEYFCVSSGAEKCDGIDNDCDNQVDEGFDIQVDPANCGACGRACQFAGAAATCAAGVCKLGACNPGFYDIDRDPANGCEYGCTLTNGGVEACDGIDNDCDRLVDESFPQQSGTAGNCYPSGTTGCNVAAGICAGTCAFGRFACVNGALTCQNPTLPRSETCDAVDNDCDGATDNGFDKQNDIRWCGSCSPCAVSNAVPRCETGVCKVGTCNPGFVDRNGNPADGCEYACTFRGAEACNGLDDDCNGLTDDTINLSTDVNNCGMCGRVCRFANAAASCSGGSCMMGACDPNFYDRRNGASDGCEYFCVPSGSPVGTEVCDGIDNDCDELTDETFDKTSDVNNCGACGRRCQFNNGSATCSAGVCRLGTCNANFWNRDGNEANGCEYSCTLSGSPVGTEICDGIDNDCDTQVDESFPQQSGGAANCYPAATAGCNMGTGVCTGECAFGTYACLGGALVCQNPKTPKSEICDNKDNDCNGTPDNGFDKVNDPRFCGGCTPCSLPNAVSGCAMSSCTIAACKPGFVNQDGITANGCEYPCTVDGPEVCDGRDNDCDTRVDTADADLLYPVTNFCSQVGECGKGPGGSSLYPGQSTYPVCAIVAPATTPDWVCNYPATVQTTGPNQIVGQESLCDGKDNDCDTATDEHLPTLGADCFDTGVGECRKKGRLVCASDPLFSPVCDFTGAPTYTVVDESCDAKDNDCDGRTDEAWDTPASQGPLCGGIACKGVRDDLVHVTTGGKNYYVYTYEASRVDATAASQGTQETRSCSRKPAAGAVRPWTSVTYAQAKAACSTAGMRLCATSRATACSSSAVTTDEWGFACNATLPAAGGNAYPYGATYDGAVCNGFDKGIGAAVQTGSLAACVTGDLDTSLGGAQVSYDMSGNIAEWTEDCRGSLADGRLIYTLRGGSYDNISPGLKCGFSSLVAAETFSFPNTGFRCCSSCAPGLADCGGTCVNLGTGSGAGNRSHCGLCGTTCTPAQTCQNGRCL